MIISRETHNLSVPADYPVQSACENGSVRLTHRDVTNTTGQVQICIDGVWRRLLAERDLWTDAAAAVVCQQLGFTGEGKCTCPFHTVDCTKGLLMYCMSR